MRLQLQHNFDRNCGYWNMASSRIFIGNAGFRSKMLTDFVEGMGRSGPHLLQDFQQKSWYTIAVATRCWTKLLIWGYGLLEDFYRKCRFEIRNADRLCRRNGNVRPSFASGFLTEILICNCSCNQILKKILVSALLKDFYRKCKFELQNAQRFCPRNEKVGPSFATKIVTKMLIWDCICNKLLKDNLNIGVWFPRESLSEMQAWASKCSKILSRKWKGWALICSRMFNTNVDLGWHLPSIWNKNLDVGIGFAVGFWT